MASRIISTGLVAVLFSLVFGSTVAVAAETTVTVGASGLAPAQLEIAVGDSVRWVNQDSARHRLRTASGPEDFDIDLDAGASGSFTFTLPGTYQYGDERNKDNAAFSGTIVVAGASTGGGGGTAGLEVRMAGRVFSPRTLQVPVGATVTFINDDARDHTATDRAGAWDSGNMAPGATFQQTFTTDATYEYFCVLHPDMVGTIVVGNGGGGAAAPPPPPPVTTTGDVSIFDFGYTPATLTVPVGTTVTWVNNGVAPHTVTDRAGRFDSGILNRGQTYRRTFDQPGTYEYFCTLHPDMVARIVVPDASGNAPPPVAPPPPPPVTSTGDISIFDNGYNPATLTVPVGTTISWVNNGVAPHTVTDRAGRFDSGILNRGQTYRRTFNQAGTYEYFCTIHPGMTARIVVTDASGNAPPPPEETLPTPEVASHGEGPAASGEVEMLDFEFAPQALTVEVGTTVAWVNSGVAPHTVTARDGSFDSGIKASGERFEYTFTELGTFEYFCTLHPDMVGTVTVVAAGGDVAGAAVAAAGVAAAPPRPRLGTYLAYGFVVILVGGMVTGMVLLKRALASV